MNTIQFAALDLDWLKTYANKAQLPPGAALDVFDWNGTILVSDSQQQVDQPTRDAPLVHVLVDEEEARRDLVARSGDLRRELALYSASTLL